ncbi:MAG TPA: hypothetical protein DCX06_11090 [Opitutae bacterium]|mgnify:CR=1 FL=1|nr:hypothetical protein [Opitutae bacterium]
MQLPLLAYAWLSPDEDVSDFIEHLLDTKWEGRRGHQLIYTGRDFDFISYIDATSFYELRRYESYGGEEGVQRVRELVF